MLGRSEGREGTHCVEAGLEIQGAGGCLGANGLLGWRLRRIWDRKGMHGIETGLEGVDAGPEVIRVFTWRVVSFDDGRVARVDTGGGRVHSSNRIGSVVRYDILVLEKAPL